MLKTPITFDLSPHCLYCFPVESTLLLYLLSTSSACLLLEFERLREFFLRAAGERDLETRRRAAGDRERRPAAAGGDRDLDFETDLSFLVEREFRDLEGDLERDLVLDRESRSAFMFIVQNLLNLPKIYN